MFKEWIKTLGVCAVLCSPLVQASAIGLAKEKEVRLFINEMVDKHSFDRSVLEAVFEQAEIKDSILKAIASPYESKPWHAYRPLFITDRHVDNGVAFWKEHRGILKDAERKYGVPPEMIVAILGIETRYGTNTGSYKVLDALSTLAFKYPPRSKFFRSELEQFLLLVNEEDLDLHELRGSYAGAIGAPQFIPSSYRHYAIDFNGSGKRDLFNSMEDVIGSVANYFAKHGWEKGAPVAERVAINTDVSSLISPRNNPKPTLKSDQLSKLNIPLHTKKDASVALIELEATDGSEYWVGYQNFYVISRYNHSSLYSMAAFQLSEAIKDRYNKRS